MIFFCKFYEILKKTSFKEHLRASTSGNKVLVKKFSCRFEVSQISLQKIKKLQKQSPEVFCKERRS